MRKKLAFTIVERAILLVPEFEQVVHRLEQQVTLRGQSKSTLQNYIRRIALFVIHFSMLPEQIDPKDFACKTLPQCFHRATFAEPCLSQ